MLFNFLLFFFHFFVFRSFFYLKVNTWGALKLLQDWFSFALAFCDLSGNSNQPLNQSESNLKPTESLTFSSASDSSFVSISTFLGLFSFFFRFDWLFLRSSNITKGDTGITQNKLWRPVIYTRSNQSHGFTQSVGPNLSPKRFNLIK